MESVWFRPLIWADYRIGVILVVILPIIILIWSVVNKTESITKLLLIYWRVASLLMITVYLMIPGWPIAFLTSIASKILIPISLWFWVDINEEIKDLPPQGLKIIMTSWRWAVTIYFSLGVIASLPFLSCSFVSDNIETPFCQVWLEAPWRYKEIFHAGSSPGFLGFLGIVGLIFYILYLGYFVFFRLSKQGRSALEQ